MALIQYLTQIEFDYGAVAQLPQHCARVGMTRPLIVTDAGVVAAGVLQPVLAALGDLPHAVFDATPSNPTEAAVRAATALYQQHQCDGLIAVGGGSAIDCAKGVAIAATHPGPLKTYATIEGGSPKITEAVAPLIAVPTTAGTGSEVARGAIVIVDDGRKLGFHSWYLMPKAAICDPALTLGLPPMLTAATGMDAIAHCMETFMAPAFNPPADGIALEGLRRGWAAIERATRDGKTEPVPVPATIDIVSSKEEMRTGDRLLPEPPRQLVSYVPRAPETRVEGAVVSMYGSTVANAAQNQIVVINKGTADGIESGHVLAILKDGQGVVDRTGDKPTVIKLPDERNGLLMVFRPFEKLSYALILEITDGVKVGDRVVNPR